MWKSLIQDQQSSVLIFTAGTEVVSSTIWNVYHVDMYVRTDMGTLAMSATSLGIFSAAFATLVVTVLQTSGWLWRVPFLLGGALTLILGWLHSKDFHKAITQRQGGERDVAASKRKMEIMVGTGVFTIYQVALYLCFLWVRWKKLDFIFGQSKGRLLTWLLFCMQVPTYLFILSPQPMRADYAFIIAAVSIGVKLVLMPMFSRLAHILGELADHSYWFSICFIFIY